jgi:O-6-methylguanine DNA methyltransferase
MKELFFVQTETPLGLMYACAAEQGVCLLEFFDRKKIDNQFALLKKQLSANIAERETPILKSLKNELSEYFAGKRQKFTVPLFLVGTDFQKKVWNELLKIPFGTTVSYMQLSEKTGDKKAVRAVANANASNKIAIIVPCHRVIGSDGSLTGYAGGLDRKLKLLNMEKGVAGLF